MTPDRTPPASAQEDQLHYLNQSGQPYGSTSRKCDYCGRMIWPGMPKSAKRRTENFDEWNGAADNCARQIPPPPAREGR